MLSVKLNLDAYRLAKKNDLFAVMFYDLMMNNIDKITDKRIESLKDARQLDFPGHKTRKLKVSHSMLEIVQNHTIN